MSLPLDVGERALDLWGGRITLRVKMAGRGAPLGSPRLACAKAHRRERTLRGPFSI